MDSRVLDDWLVELTRRKWTHFYWPGTDEPNAMASVFRWDGYADVVALFPEQDAYAYRAPVTEHADPFNPAFVLWVYGGDPVWTIRGLLALSPPGSPHAPVVPMTAPPVCWVLPSVISKSRGVVMRRT
jgi:hypothetical protein